MMEYKEIVTKACSHLYDKYRSPESDNICEIVKERAKNMDNTENNPNVRKLVEITVPHVEKKKSKAPVIAAIAGFTAAAAGIGFFAGNYYGNNGISITPLREGGSAASSGYASEADPVITTVQFLDPDEIKENSSGYIAFDDFDVEIIGIDFDGKVLNAHYNLIYHDEASLQEDISGEPRVIIADKNGVTWDESELISGLGVGRSTPALHPNTVHYDCSVTVNSIYGGEESVEICLCDIKPSDDPDHIRCSDIITVHTNTAPAVTTTAVPPVPGEEVPLTTAVSVTSPAEAVTAVTEAASLWTISGSEYDNGSWYDYSDLSITINSFEYDGRAVKVNVSTKGDAEPYPALFITRQTDYRSDDASLPLTLRSVNMQQTGYENDDGTYTLYCECDIPDNRDAEFMIKHLPHTIGSSSALEEGPTFTIHNGEGSSEVVYNKVGVDMTDYGLPGLTLEWVSLSSFELRLDLTSKKEINTDPEKINIMLSDDEGNSLSLHDGDGGLGGELNVYEEPGLYHSLYTFFPRKTDTDLKTMRYISVNGLESTSSEYMPISWWTDLEASASSDIG